MGAIGSGLELRAITGGLRKNGGAYREWRYEGTRDAVNTAFASFFSAGGIDDLLINRAGNNLWELIVRRDDVFPASFPITHQVRLVTQRVQKSIFEPPLPPAFDSLTDAEIAEVKEEVRNPTPGFSVVYSNEAQQALYSLAIRGVQYRIVYQPHLIRQSTASNAQVWVVSFSNVGKIFSTPAVVADAGIGTPLRFALPSDVSQYDDYVYGWLKHGVSVEPGPENIEVLSQEYEYGLWSTWLYEVAG